MKCRLKELRIARGLTQTGIAMELNVSQQTISRIEMGVSDIPMDLAVRAAAYFHVSVGYLIGISDERLVISNVHKGLYIMDHHADFLFDYLSLPPEAKEKVAAMVKRLKEVQDRFTEE